MLPTPYGLVLLEETSKCTSKQRPLHTNVTECWKYFLHKSVWSDNRYIHFFHNFLFIPVSASNLKVCSFFSNKAYWKLKNIPSVRDIHLNLLNVRNHFIQTSVQGAFLLLVCQLWKEQTLSFLAQNYLLELSLWFFVHLSLSIPSYPNLISVFSMLFSVNVLMHTAPSPCLLTLATSRETGRK